MEPTIVKISRPADIVGVIPHRLGFHPAESLVVMCLRGPRQRDQLVMRLDLPLPGHDPEVGGEVARRLVAVGADAAVAVVYTDGAPPKHGLVRAPLVRSLRRQIRRAGMELVEALLVRDGRWWSYLCQDETCCPPAGTPVPAVPTGPVALYAAESVARGAVVLDDRAALRRSIEPTGPCDEQAADDIADALVAVLAAEGPEGLRRQVLTTVDRLARRWASGSCVVEPAEAQLVATGLWSKLSRDWAMTQVLDHEPPVLMALFSEIARRTADPDAAPVCTVLSWFAYASGSGALASLAAERALRCDPTYEMAQLILAGLRGMQPPATVMQVSALVRADLEEQAEAS